MSKRNKKYTYSIIIPAFNEERVIADTPRSIINYMKRKNYSYEIIVVDDGSTDTTKNIVETIKKQNENIRLISHGKNKGKALSVKTGMLSASGDIRLFTDADNATDISNLDSFIPYFNSFDVCIGSRGLKNSKIVIHQPFYKEYLGKMGHFLIRYFMSLDFNDTQCGFKCFKKETAEKIFPLLKTNGWGFDIEVLLRAKKMGYKIIELPVTWACGQNSKVRPIDYLRTLLELLKIKRILKEK